MTPLEFEDQNSTTIKQRLSEYYNSERQSSILIRLGIVKNEEDKQKLLIFVSIIIILISLYFFWQYRKANKTGPVRYGLSYEVINKLPKELQEKILLK